jgi:hypothetical protein
MGRCSFGAASTAMVGVYHRWFLCVLCVVRERGCVHKYDMENSPLMRLDQNWCSRDSRRDKETGFSRCYLVSRHRA